MGAPGESARELLVFDVEGRTYGLPANEIVELVRAVAVAPLPDGPRAVSGVINLRGRVVPVFDVRVRFGTNSPPIELSDHFIVARARARVVAIRADRVVKLSTIDSDDIVHAERIVSGTSYIAGIAAVDGGIVVIHDLDAFLSETEEATLDRALGASLETA
jgi:purine-binding chemotaxis protein CheW